MKIMINGKIYDADEEQIRQIELMQNAISKENVSDYKDALANFINDKATERLYENGASCASYFNSTNDKWKAEARAFVPWRDSVYEYGFNYLSMVESGDISNPNIYDFIKGIPAMIWPEID